MNMSTFSIIFTVLRLLQTETKYAYKATLLGTRPRSIRFLHSYLGSVTLNNDDYAEIPVRAWKVESR